MKLELKKIKLGPGSEETTQFTAELYVNGKLAAHCDNAGKGGCTDIRAYEPGQRELVAQAETYCATLPPLDLGRGTTIPMNLEHWVDGEVEKEANSKHLSKEKKRILAQLNRDAKRYAVVISRKDFDDFNSGINLQLKYGTYDFKHPLDRFSDNAKRQIVEQITANLKGDEFIYNENLPK